MKFREYTMENTMFKCEEYVCERTGIKLEKVSPVKNITNLVSIRFYLTDISKTREIYESEFNTIKKLIEFDKMDEFFKIDKPLGFEILEIKNIESGECLKEALKYISDLHKFFNTKAYTFHSLKRLSDGEKFTIGDNVTYGGLERVIHSFNYNYNNHKLYVFFEGREIGMEVFEYMNKINPETEGICHPTEITINGIEYILTPKQK